MSEGSWSYFGRENGERISELRVGCVVETASNFALLFYLHFMILIMFLLHVILCFA